MKTTIEIPDELHEETKRLARREGLTPSRLVEEGLRRVIAARRLRQPFRLKDAGFTGHGVRPGVEEGRWELGRPATTT